MTTGRRIGEVVQVRWDCLGRYNGLPMFWHDQTKVGNYDVAIRIPERLHDVIAERQRKTLDRFTAHHGRRPAGAERAGLALFPTTHRNHDGTQALSYNWFHTRFQAWITALDLGHCVPHQARHTLATNLLRAGASLTHIRTYLGQVSDRMAEHYVHLSNSDLEDVLQQVWVAGPGTANPGELLTKDTSAMTREQAQALAIDLSRRSTPAEGGFCTFQPVVEGGACPWNLDCHNCDKFVLSGADLLYWRRKREQWRQLAEGAPDDATADYLHRYFEPTARAIDGLEERWLGSGYWISRSRSTYASRRTTSAGCGRPRFALPILRTPPILTTATPSTMNRKPAHDRVPSISTTHRRSVGGTAPRHPSRARPCPRHHRTAAPGEDPGQRRRRRPPSRCVENVHIHQCGRKNRCQQGDSRDIRPSPQSACRGRRFA